MIAYETKPTCSNCRGRGWTSPLCDEPPIPKEVCESCFREPIDILRAALVLDRKLVGIEKDSGALIQHIVDMHGAFSCFGVFASEIRRQIWAHPKVVAAKIIRRKLRGEGISWPNGM